MISFSAFLQATRPRTYPLALVGILVGNALAYQQLNAFNLHHWQVFALSLWVALSLQILSNLANDYGDGVKGTDSHRSDRQTAQGKINAHLLKKIVISWALFTFCCGVVLLWLSFDNLKEFLTFLAFGILAIISAITYTMGKNPYGYNARGEIAVFIFFGLLNVCGSLYLQTQYIYTLDILVAIAIGLLCTCVLMINNFRDIQEDQLSGKNTLAVVLGKQKAYQLYQSLMFLTYTILTTYGLIKANIKLIALIILIFPIYRHLKALYSYTNNQITAQQLIPQLKNIIIITLLTSIIFILSTL